MLDPLAKPLCLNPPAKLNLFLEVLRRRADGYHDLDSVFQAVSLCDRLEAWPVPADQLTLECDHPELPVDQRNSVLQAALALKNQTGRKGGIHFRLRKKIPTQAGLGGGSSDAAAALLLANHLLGAGLSREELVEVAREVGSDVPFFLYGGGCRCQGRGDQVTPLATSGEGRRFTLVLSNLKSNTSQAYQNIRLPQTGEERTAWPTLEALANPDLAKLAPTAFNRFESSVFQDLPVLGEIHAALAEIPGIIPRLSGSGSALWFPSPTIPVSAAQVSQERLARLAEKYHLRLVETLGLGPVSFTPPTPP
ncbi:MAG: 4-(cytidine 5'-diphospho)-2-C-methyl-D-erythritol kinase [Planctomycetota bacterium]|jgi:4-diphosphocytidyl-2-C-methyl-D-erythritol kinase|nr:4-(cytidine 5'-diphospho)-2-C-methyl-D-erythritol kinase [Planctomycetota bacterium]